MSGKRKRRDPDAPKRALSAYIFFTQAARAGVKVELGDGASIGDIGKALGVKWRALSEREKRPYTAKAEKDRRRVPRMGS